MPYLSDKIKLPRSLDRRVKITGQEKKEIRQLHGKLSIRSIARKYPHISRRSIQFILFPTRLEVVKQRAIEVKRWTKGNKKEFHTPAMRKYRAYKHRVYTQGLITATHLNATSNPKVKP